MKVQSYLIAIVINVKQIVVMIEQGKDLKQGLFRNLESIFQKIKMFMVIKRKRVALSLSNVIPFQ